MIRRLIVIVSVVLALSHAGKVCFGESTIAWDGFESGISGGAGWNDDWVLDGNSSITDAGFPHQGSQHLRLRSSDGIATRMVNMTGVVAVHDLSFWWKADSFEAGEYASMEVYDGSWHTVLTVVDGEDDNAYHLADVNLAGYNMVGQVRAASHMGVSGDYFYIDDILITGTLVQYTINGKITTGGSGLGDVNLIGLSVATDANGFYTASVDYGFSGVVTPTKPGYTFDPNSRSYANVTADIADQNYSAFPSDNFNDNRKNAMWRYIVK